MIGMVGVFELHPVNEDARKRMESGELLGINLRPDDYVEPGCPAAAIYIGGIAGKDNLDRAAVELFCERELYNCEFAEGSGRTVFATPTTTRGYFAALRNEFVPFDPSKDGMGALYVRNLPEQRAERRPKVGEVLASAKLQKS